LSELKLAPDSEVEFQARRVHASSQFASVVNRNRKSFERV
jgi:hypothetical protein